MLLTRGRGRYRGVAGLALAVLAPLGGAAPQQMEEAAPGAGPAGASFGEPGTGSVDARIGWFDMPDSGAGNPFLDESLTVIEPVVVYDYNWTERMGLALSLSYDYVSSASIDRLSKFPEQSGATGDYYYGVDAGFRHRLSSRTRLGWHLGYSTEYDYSSIALGASLARDYRDGDASLGLALDAFVDTVDVIRFDGSTEGSEGRTSLAATASWYQILSPEWFGEVGLTLGYQTGFLETPYNAVVVEDPTLPPNPNLANMARGYEIPEELPDERLRSAVYGRARRSLGDLTSAELEARLYGDDWGVQSVTVEPRLYRELVAQELMLRARYRFYTQTAADYFVEDATGDEEYRTQDSDLGEFHTHGFGLQFLWRVGGAHTVDLGADYVLRSDGLDHVFGSLGWHWIF